MRNSREVLFIDFRPQPPEIEAQPVGLNTKVYSIGKNSRTTRANLSKCASLPFFFPHTHTHNYCISSPSIHYPSLANGTFNYELISGNQPIKQSFLSTNAPLGTTKCRPKKVGKGLREESTVRIKNLDNQPKWELFGGRRPVAHSRTNPKMPKVKDARPKRRFVFYIARNNPNIRASDYDKRFEDAGMCGGLVESAQLIPFGVCFAWLALAPRVFGEVFDPK